MTKSLKNPASIKQENAGHTLNVALGIKCKMSIERRLQHPRNARQIQELSQFCASQAKRLIEFALRITETRHIQQPIRLEKPLRFFLGAEMHKR